MKRILLIGMLLVSFSLLLSSCIVRRGVVRSGPMVMYHYWYYPSLQCYYDADHRFYYYRSHGGWHRSPQRPPHFVNGSARVMVDVDSDRPYRDYDKHRTKYRFDHR